MRSRFELALVSCLALAGACGHQQAVPEPPGGHQAAAGPPGRVIQQSPDQMRATGISRGAIQFVVNSHMRDIQRCYEQELSKHAGLSGRVVFDWVITSQGAVGAVRQASTDEGLAVVAACIKAEIRTWQFPPSPARGEVEIRYPFVFRDQRFQ